MGACGPHPTVILPRKADKGRSIPLPPLAGEGGNGGEGSGSQVPHMTDLPLSAPERARKVTATAW
jgi:hypothetical protein